jgi:hypothetical protein
VRLIPSVRGTEVHKDEGPLVLEVFRLGSLGRNFGDPDLLDRLGEQHFVHEPFLGSSDTIFSGQKVLRGVRLGNLLEDDQAGAR